MGRWKRELGAVLLWISPVSGRQETAPGGEGGAVSPTEPAEAPVHPEMVTKVAFNARLAEMPDPV